MMFELDTINPNIDFIFFHSQDLLMILDRDQNIIKISQRAIEVLKLDPHSVYGNKFSSVMERLGAKPFLNQPKAREYVSNTQLQVDETIIVNVHWHVKVQYQNNQIVSYFLLGRPIKLEPSQKKIFTKEEIIDNHPIALVWKNKQYKIEGYNKQFLQQFFLSSEQVILGDSINEFAKKTGLPRNWVKETLHNEKVVLSQGKILTNEQSFEFQGKHKNTYLTVTSPIFSEDKIKGLITAFIDITKRKSIETKLAQFLDVIGEEVLGRGLESEENISDQIEWVRSFLDIITKQMPGYVYWKNSNCTYLGCNESILKLTGIKSRSDFVGKTDFDFAKTLNWPEGMAEKIHADDIEILTKNETKITEEVLKQSDGSELILLSTKTAILDRTGRSIGIIGVSADITERKQTERALLEEKNRAEIANQAKSNFLATMSHELRTPLNAILGMSQILKEKHLYSEHLDYVNAILLSGKNLLALINDILDFSKLEAGKIVIKRKVFDLKILLNEIRTSMLYQLEDKVIKFRVKYDPSVPKNVIGDALRIRQVVINLVSNAIKFTDKGKISIEVKSLKQNAKTANIQFIVKDTGIGISKDRLSDIFNRFTQLESHYSRRFGGVGLGLSISKQLVEAMGGEINVNSKVGKGSKFCFKLPFRLPSSADSHITQTPPEDKERPILKEKFEGKILLVEDNELNQKIAAIMLNDIGCKVDIAEDGQKGLTLFLKNHYDLIFMDIGLPDMDGLAVTRAIRLRESTSQHIPIIALTAHVLEEDVDNCLSAGADDVLLKPIMKDQLQDMLTRWLV